MALSESGLAGQGIIPGPMIYGPAGSRRVIKAKRGSAKGSTKGRGKNFYVKPRASRKGAGR